MIGRARFIPAEEDTQSCSSHRLRQTPDRLSPRARGARARVSVESHIRVWPQPASGGPSHSRHANTKFVTCPFGLSSQLTVTRPVGTDKAPYLTALVTSS